MGISENLDSAFGAIANSKRRDIISALALQPLSITKLAQFSGLSLPAIHKHIRVLEKADLVTRRKIGRTNFLILNPGSLLSVQNWLLKHRAHWGSAQATLHNYNPDNSFSQSQAQKEYKRKRLED